MPVSLSVAPKFQGFDLNGDPLVGGLLDTFAAGTTTPLATYTDSTGGTPNTNPVVLNSRGECDLWLTEGLGYKLRLRDAGGVQLWVVDNLLIAVPPSSTQMLPTGMTLSTASVTLTAASPIAAGFLDAGQIVLAVRWQVTQSFSTANGLATLSLGDPGLTNRFGNGVSPVAGAAVPLVFSGLPVFPAATDLALYAEGGAFGATGAVRATKYLASFGVN